MKTVKLSAGDVVRRSNAEAHELVTTGNAEYVPKSAWKAVRPASKPDVRTLDRAAVTARSLLVQARQAPQVEVPESDLTLPDLAEEPEQ